MHKQIFVNLAVSSVEKSMAFFSQLGFAFEPRFTNEQAACMVIGENIYAMLLAKDFFQTFTNKTLCNPKESTEALIRAIAAGRSMIWSRRRWLLAAPSLVPRRIMASCTAAASRTSTGTSGN